MLVDSWNGRIGKTVTLLRKVRHISQEELSFISGVDRTYMSRIEQGKANPTLCILQRVAYALEVSLVELLEGKS